MCSLETIVLGIEKLIKVRYLTQAMRLLSQKSREYKGKDYKKHWIIISNKIIEELEWKSGDDLKAKTKDKKLVIEKD